ncbi:MAG: polysaccharide pyruvyl transferase family protein [Luteimonas sp.]|nr:polysaccharide pyruvyl transferase family protein [Luteimonas sp.]
MKYGVVVQKYPRNVGDDIWAYAASLFLPSIDYLIDRDRMADFATENNEPIATIFAAYMMHKFHRFPPARNIWLLPVGVHFSAGYSALRSPVTDQHLSGVSAEHLRTFGPVGARDISTRDTLLKHGIDAYFSGCITLTLPKQEVSEKGNYVCVVDLDEGVEKRVRRMLRSENVEIRKLSHVLKKRRTDKNSDWQTRVADAKEILATYQGAKCVITSRLHASLPCLAMEVPTFNIRSEGSPRFNPYHQWLYGTTPEKFLAGQYDYDFVNPPDNKGDYLPYRNAIIERCKAFIEETMNGVRPEPTYSELELLRWQNGFMSWLLDEYEPILKDLAIKEDKYERMAKMIKRLGKNL